MKTALNTSPRTFEVKGHAIKDFGKIYLADGEMISFVTPNGKEYDFSAKEWGFYATPSINSRLKKEGFKTALVVNENNQLYVMSVDVEKMEVFKMYLMQNHDNRIICWLDDFFKSDL
ncbi:MAG: hypothetical protein Q8J85_02905 [Sulfuricurvum sp.]|nr:hypothetical protein [Sulfuricurvum sp.]MDP3023101.1 hypothetical protein [Sulfuricurvum sp.]